jgi:hypothetical protein
MKHLCRVAVVVSSLLICVAVPESALAAGPPTEPSASDAFLPAILFAAAAFVLVSGYFWLKMLISCLRTDSQDKTVWVLVLVLLGLLGALIYYFMEYSPQKKR